MNVAVFCSSSDDIDIKYIESSKKLLEKIFEKENNLIFGVYPIGIMGLSYKIAKNAGRKIIGITPNKEDFINLECTEEIITKSVNQRTDTMIEKSDILLFLPGGIGTIYELFTAIEKKRNKEFDKPIYIYNETGFFDNVINLLNKIYDEKFSNIRDVENYSIIKRIEEINI